MTLLVVDGSNAIHRAHYAVPPMSHKGFPTNAIVGFMRILKSNIRKYRPHFCVVVFDRPGKNHRHELFPKYKQTRPKHPEVQEAIEKQIPVIVDLCRAYGVKVIGKRNIEGDDIVGQLAYDYVDEYEGDAYILSGDKDFGQLLVNENIKIINPNKGVVVTKDNIKDIYGVEAHQVVDYLMMEGDKIDNIPGVYGIGPATACSLLSEYGKLKNIPRERFPKNARDNFEALQEQFKLTRKLIRLKLDVIECDFDSMTLKKPDKEKVSSICEQYRMDRLKGDLLGTVKL